jgi:hypothetical protein
MSLQPFNADGGGPSVFCEHCSWSMRLRLIAPVWASRAAETHTYECGICKHTRSFLVPLNGHSSGPSKRQSISRT